MLRVTIFCLFLWVQNASVYAAEDVFALLQQNDVTALKNILVADSSLAQKLNRSQQTLLIAACSAGQIDMVKMLVQQGVPLNKSDSRKRCALYHAVARESEEMVSILCSIPVDVNVVDSSGNSPLYSILSQMRREHTQTQSKLVKILLAGGANPLLENGRKETPLSYALANNTEEIVQELFKTIKNPKKVVVENPGLVVKAMANTKHDIFSVLYPYLDKPLQWVDKDGLGLLHLSAAHGNAMAIKILLSNEHDIEAVDKRGATALHKAASGRSRECVAMLLAHNADMYAETKSEFSVMHLAIKNRTSAMPGILLDNGFDSSRADSKGDTALHYAVENDRYMMVSMLCQRGVDVDAINKGGYSPLAIALSKNRTYIAKFLRVQEAQLMGPMCELAYNALRNGRADEAMRYVESYTFKKGDAGVAELLNQAVSQGRIEILESMKRAGIDMNQKVHGRHMLYTYLNSESISSESFQRYIDLGWDITAIDKEKHVLEKIIQSCRNVIIYTSRSNQGTVRFKPAHQEIIKIVKLLLEEKCINIKKEHGTYILDAIAYGDIALANLLDAHGAPLFGQNKGNVAYKLRQIRNNTSVGWLFKKIKNESERNSIFIAIARGRNRSLLDALYDSELVDINYADKIGHTGLHNAIQGGDFESVQWYLDKNANVNTQIILPVGTSGRGGFTPMHSAVRANNVKILEVLISAGGDVKIMDRNGYMPIHAAVEYGNTEAVDVLIKAGADINACIVGTRYNKREQGQSALHLLAGSHRRTRDAKRLTTIIAHLVKHGINLEAVDAQGKTAADLAMKNSNIIMLNILKDHGAKIDSAMMVHAQVQLYIKKGQHAELKLLLVNNPDIARDLIMKSLESSKIGRMSTEILTVLFDSYPAGVNLITADKSRTPMSYAVKDQNSRLVKICLAYNADPLLTDAAGWMYIHHAELGALRSRRGVEVLKMIIDHGIPASGVSNETWRVYAILGSRGDSSAVAAMVNSWNGMKDWPKFLEPPQYLAISNGKTEILGEMIARGMDPNVKNKQGDPILFAAIESRRIQFVRTLVGASVQQNVTRANGESVEECVRRIGDAFIAKELGVVLVEQEGEAKGAIEKRIRESSQPQSEFDF